MEDSGKYVWLEDEHYGWLPARIINSENSNYRFHITIDGKTLEKFDSKDKHYPEVHTSCLKGVEDLLLLGDLDAQTLLHNTRVRFAKDRIYTFIGMPILIAVNPYKNLNIYNDSTIKQYKKYFTKLKTNPNNIESPVPHVYYIAEAAYQDMLTERKNQSIIISGESGSGKTQSTKIILKYLAVSSLFSSSHEINESDLSNKQLLNSSSTINTSSASAEEKVTVEKQVLDSNPLMEAFGNAKTSKNNNSSRFGKFIQVNFSQNGKILSAKIYNYLLEKSRIVNIQPNERNYHIFYQLICGADQKERSKYQIREIEHFNYLNKGCFEVEDTDDAANFLETKECMLKLKFKQEEMAYIFAVLMGILYLGNVNFLEEDHQTNGTGSIIDPLSKSDFNIASELLGIDPPTLSNVLTKRKMKDPMSDNYFERLLTVDKAYNSRDALAKTIYSRVFDFIIRRVNQAIANADEMKNAKNVLKIGLLDIFGFENFEINSFEQLCINYANERLQQYFNNHIFKLEQEEYKKEQIDFTTVEFKDNNEIIELIDAPKKSIFSFLDSEAITPNGCDLSFEANVYKYLESNPHLNCEDRMEEFICIYHYAGEVYYNTFGFLEKNIDQVTQDTLDALQTSKSKLLKKIFEKKEEEVKKKGKSSSNAASSSGKNITSGPSKLQSDSLSKQFKKQLDELMKMLSQSNPRYVRCIKPNGNKKPMELDSLDVSDQLLSAGVLEAIKIRKQGYSIRRTHEEFVKRYLRLYPDLTHKIKIYEEKGNFKDAVLEMFQSFSKIPEMKVLLENEKKFIQFGVTKVFMKEEVKDILEYKLNRIKFIQRIQNNFRRWKVQRRIMKIIKAIRKIQAVCKGMRFRRFFKKLKKAIKIQRAFRRYTRRITIWRNLKNIAREQRMIREKERLRKLEEERKNNPNFKLQESSDINFDVKETVNMDNNEFYKENGSFDFKDNKGILHSKSKHSAKNALSMIGADGSSGRNNIGDISSSDMQLVNELKSLGRKQTARKSRLNEKNTFSDLLSSNIGNVLDNELKQSLQNLKEELENTRIEKEKLLQELNTRKEEIKRKDTEIEILKTATPQKISFDNLEKSSEFDAQGKQTLTDNERLKFQEEIRKLKQDLSDKEGNLDILNLKIDELTKSNRDLQSINEGLNDQLLKRKEKFDAEMMSLYNQMKELEMKKTSSVGAANCSGANDLNALNRNISNIENEAKKQISEAKQENKILAKKYEDIKAKYEKELSNLKHEIGIKDSKLSDLENQILKKEKLLAQLTQKNGDLLRENSDNKNEVDTLNIKMKNLVENSNVNRENIQEYEMEINKLKKDNELKIIRKDQELNDLRDALETMRSNNERLKKMENALKNELAIKDNEIAKRQEILKEVHRENEKISDENLNFKKENYNLQSKLQILEMEYKNKYELELQLKNKEMKELKENVAKYEKYIGDLKESISRKKEVIENKKQMNIILCDLAKVKKAEVQCLETLQYANTENIRKTLEKIRANEKDLLEKLNEVSNLEDYEYESDEEEIEDGSEGSEYYEYDFIEGGDDK